MGKLSKVDNKYPNPMEYPDGWTWALSAFLALRCYFLLARFQCVLLKGILLIFLPRPHWLNCRSNSSKKCTRPEKAAGQWGTLS